MLLYRRARHRRLSADAAGRDRSVSPANVVRPRLEATRESPSARKALPHHHVDAAWALVPTALSRTCPTIDERFVPGDRSVQQSGNRDRQGGNEEHRVRPISRDTIPSRREAQPQGAGVPMSETIGVDARATEVRNGMP